MTDGRPTFDATEEEFRAVLTGEHPGLRGVRRMMRRFPTDPRCKLCWAPFEGLGGQVLRHIGYARFGGNPSLCEKCIREFKKAGLTGATIPVTLESRMTEVGTLELWCVARDGARRWRLELNIRERDAD